MTVVQLASATIRMLESVELIAYRDTGGVWTIGFGHTGLVDGVAIHAGMTITLAKAEELLALDQAALLKMVADRPMIEAAAYVSFGYNAGQTALQHVLSGQSQMADFIHDRTKQVVGNLVRRRAFEAALIEASREVMKHAA